MEVTRLGRTPATRAEDILAYFDRLPTLRGSPRLSTAPGVPRQLGPGVQEPGELCMARNVLEAGGFRLKLHVGLP